MTSDDAAQLDLSHWSTDKWTLSRSEIVEADIARLRKENAELRRERARLLTEQRNLIEGLRVERRKDELNNAG